MTERTHERRLFPRVAVQAPVFARPLSRDRTLAAGARVGGMLLDASRSGVAFESRGPLLAGELVELTVLEEDREGLVRFARVVACEPHPDNEFLLRCAFVEPTPDEVWITALRRSSLSS